MIADEDSDSFRDDGTAIATALTTRSLIFNDPISPKTGLSCEIDFVSAAGSPQFAVYGSPVADLATALTFNLGVTGSTDEKQAFGIQNIGQFRELHFGFTAASSKQTVRSIQASAFVDSMVLQS